MRMHVRDELMQTKAMYAYIEDVDKVLSEGVVGEEEITCQQVT